MERGIKLGPEFTGTKTHESLLYRPEMFHLLSFCGRNVRKIKKTIY